MKEQMEIEVIYEPHPDAARRRAMGLDALAEALADLFIARARAEVARELGVAEEDIDREHGRADADLRNLASMGMALDSTCDDCVTTQADTLKASRRPRRAAGRKG